MESRNVMEFEAAVPRVGTLPVVIESLTVTEVNGQRTFIIKVRRDLTVSLRSYTVAYCFLAQNVEDVSDISSFRRKTYSDRNINTESVMYFTGRLPPQLQIDGCGAYVAEIVYANGFVQKYLNTDFVTPGAYPAPPDIPFDDGVEWAENADDYAALLSGSSEADYTSTPFADAPVYGTGPFGTAASPGGTGPSGGSAPSGGTGTPGADGAQNTAGLRPSDISGPSDGTGPSGGASGTTSAERTGGKSPGKNVKEGKSSKKRAKKKAARIAVISAGVICIAAAVTFSLLIYSKSGRTSTVEELIAEGRYTEAYKIAGDYDSLRTDVARRAVKHYLAVGDIKNAYVFACLAGNAAEVTDAAMNELGRLGEDALGSDYFAVALKAEDKGRLDAAIDSLAASLADASSYEKAMNATLFIADDTLRTERSGSIFYRGISHYTGQGQYEAAAALIKRYGSARSFDGTVDENTVTQAITYCAENGDSASAVLLAKYFGRDYSGIGIAPGDRSVRGSIGAIYPLLTDAQRLTYHSYPLAYCKDVFQITDGAVSGTDITDAAAIDTYEFRTVVLHTDGRVTMLANGGHNETDDIPADLRAVQALCGLHHTVALRSDGTCAAFGSNDYGQCNVSEWTDIVAVAAGRYFTLGLRSDGTVAACGANLEGQCNVSDYRNVVGIAACDQTAVLMFADGTLHVQGDVTMGMYELNTLENVAEVSCRANTAVVRFDDGTYRVICASESSSAGDATNLAGAQCFRAGSTSVAYVDSDGKLQIMGDGAPRH